jgi:hypothetical protein
MSKTKVTFEYAVRFYDGRIFKCHDAEEAHRIAKEQHGIVVSRQNTVTKGEWQ